MAHMHVHTCVHNHMNTYSALPSLFQRYSKFPQMKKKNLILMTQNAQPGPQWYLGILK